MDLKKIKSRFSEVKEDANSWSPQWKDIQAYVAPNRGYFEGSVPNNGVAIDYKTIINGSATDALTTLASGMTSGLTSPSRPWFKLGLADEDLMEFDPVKYWLDAVEKKMYTVFQKSGIYGTLTNMYYEIGAFGTAGAMIYEDFDTVIRGHNFTCGEYYLGINEKGKVDTVARVMPMTAIQIVSKFGIDNVSDAVKQAYNGSRPGSYFNVCYLCEPNDTRIPGLKDAKNMAFRAVYWEEGSKEDKALRISGFNEFPGLFPRWGVTRPADVYGRSSPGWLCLGDIKMLQKMETKKLKALDKVVDPPMQRDASVTGDVNNLPGGITFSTSQNPNAGVRPAYQIQPDLPAITNDIGMVEARIRHGFFADLFLMLYQGDVGKDMTAREVVERHEEKLVMLGPLLGSLHGELHNPLIDRTFNVMLRAGLLPPPPKELQGMDLNVNYISMLDQAQKMVGNTAIEQTFAFAGNLAAVNPESLDVLDFDEGISTYAKNNGIAPKIIRSADAIADLRQKRQQAQQAAQMAEQAPALIDGAKTLSETRVGQNSALDAVLGGIAGTPSGQSGTGVI